MNHTCLVSVFLKSGFKKQNVTSLHKIYKAEQHINIENLKYNKKLHTYCV